MTLAGRLLPSPLLSALLFLAWLALARDVDAGQCLLGGVLAVVVPLLLPRLFLRGVRVRNPRAIIRYLGVVARDVVHSNFAVARGVLRWRRRPPAAAFVTIPLDLRDPVGLAVLAMVTTIVPGTVWSELAQDRRTLLLHVWDVPDADAFVAFYKARYEQPLREIFE